MRKRIVQGTMTKITGGDHTINALQGNIIQNAALDIKQQGAENGIVYNIPQFPPKANTEVLEIKHFDSNLDVGSANDGSKTGKQLGMVFDKIYGFQIKSYSNGEPPEHKKFYIFTWKVRYYNEQIKDWETEIYPNFSDFFTLLISEKHCGRYIHITAYINNEECKTLMVWCHNRFLWFDGKLVKEQILNRTKNPELINQGSTSLCGMASLYYLLAKEDPQGYKTFITEYFRTGKSTHNDYTLELTGNKEHIYSRNPYEYKNHPQNIPEADWLALASTRIKQSHVGYSGEAGEDAQAINWPQIMTGLSESLLGYSDVEGNNIYKPLKPIFHNRGKTNNKVKEINHYRNQGYQIIMLIDSDLISHTKDGWFTSFSEYHWVVLDSNITIYEFYNGKNEVETSYYFRVFSWGTNTTFLKEPIDWRFFSENFYGYIKVK